MASSGLCDMVTLPYHSFDPGRTGDEEYVRTKRRSAVS